MKIYLKEKPNEKYIDFQLPSLIKAYVVVWFVLLGLWIIISYSFGALLS